MPGATLTPSIVLSSPTTRKPQVGVDDEPYRLLSVRDSRSGSVTGFLNEEERLFVAGRMGPHAPKGTDKHFDKKEFFDTLSSWYVPLNSHCFKRWQWIDND